MLIRVWAQVQLISRTRFDPLFEIFYPFLKPLNLWKFHKNFKESNSELEASSGFTTQENG